MIRLANNRAPLSSGLHLLEIISVAMAQSAITISSFSEAGEGESFARRTAEVGEEGKAGRDVGGFENKKGSHLTWSPFSHSVI